ncbi:MAG: SUF system Fe-S cluster assembly regulator [Gammaproteobacteria bacterium]
MLRLGKLTDYALLLMHTMSQPSESGRWCTEQLSLETHLPTPTVRKCLKYLVKAGLVDSFRGVQGGYQLNQCPDCITLAAIIQAIEGPILLAECHSSDGRRCDLDETCGLKGPLRSVGEIVMNFLDTVTLAELAAAQNVQSLMPQMIAVRGPA